MATAPCMFCYGRGKRAVWFPVYHELRWRECEACDGTGEMELRGKWRTRRQQLKREQERKERGR